MSKKTCKHCSEPATTVGLCNTHYSYANRWMRAGVKRAAEHNEKLAARSALLSDLVPGRILAPSNVVELSRHPRFEARRLVTKGRKRRAG